MSSITYGPSPLKKLKKLWDDEATKDMVTEMGLGFEEKITPVILETLKNWHEDVYLAGAVRAMEESGMSPLQMAAKVRKLLQDHAVSILTLMADIKRFSTIAQDNHWHHAQMLLTVARMAVEREIESDPSLSAPMGFPLYTTEPNLLTDKGRETLKRFGVQLKEE